MESSSSRHTRGRITSVMPLCGVVITLALQLVACELPPVKTAPATTQVGPGNGEVCAQLAHVFFLVAQSRDKGASREDEISRLRESVQNRFVKNPDQALRQLIRVVDLVYLARDESADSIRGRVQADCDVNRRGDAVLGTFWPVH